MLLAAVEGHTLQVGGGATVVILHGSHGVGKRFIVGASTCTLTKNFADLPHSVGDELKLPVLRISISQLCLEPETVMDFERRPLACLTTLFTVPRKLALCSKPRHQMEGDGVLRACGVPVFHVRQPGLHLRRDHPVV